MVLSQNIVPGMILSLNGTIYRVESSVKVTVAKGNPFMKVTLRDVINDEIEEKTLKLNQNIQDVTLAEKKLEFLYPEGDQYLFLDIENLDQLMIPSEIVGDKIYYLKEGVDVVASVYGEIIFSIELPQFLELMVAKIDEAKGKFHKDKEAPRFATLETGAEVEVPPFIASGDIVKVNTQTQEFVQRV